jgi:hypothetical protein
VSGWGSFHDADHVTFAVCHGYNPGIVIDLANSKHHKVILTVENPEDIAARLSARCWRRRRHVDHRSRWRVSRGWLDDQGAERCGDLVAAEWDLTVWWRTLFASAGPGDGSCWDVAGWPRSC